MPYAHLAINCATTNAALSFLLCSSAVKSSIENFHPKTLRMALRVPSCSDLSLNKNSERTSGAMPVCFATSEIPTCASATFRIPFIKKGVSPSIRYPSSELVGSLMLPLGW